MGEQKRRQQLDPNYGKPILGLMDYTPPLTTGVSITLGLFTPIELLETMSPQYIQALGIKEVGVYIPVFIESCTISSVTYPAITGIAFPHVSRNKIVRVGAMFSCEDKSIPKEKADRLVEFITDLAERELNYLVSTAYKRFIGR